MYTMEVKVKINVKLNIYIKLRPQNTNTNKLWEKIFMHVYTNKHTIIF